MRATTRTLYLKAAGLRLAGLPGVDICKRLSMSARTLRRALAWYASQRVALTVEEELSLAIIAKEMMKRKIMVRLAKLQKGWTCTKTVTAGDKVLETAKERLFSPNSEVGLFRILMELDDSLNELRGILQHVRRNPPEDSGPMELNITMRGLDQSGLEPWEKAQLYLTEDSNADE
jgi:hypothetical protein